MKNTLIEQFANYLKYTRQLSDATIDGYVKDLTIFFTFLKQHLNLKIDIKDINIFILNSVKRNDIYSYLIYLNEYRDNSAITRQRKLCSLKTFYRYLYFKYSCDFENCKVILEAIKSIPETLRLPKYFSLEQARKLQQVFTSENCIFPIRNNTIISMFLNTRYKAFRVNIIR